MQNKMKTIKPKWLLKKTACDLVLMSKVLGISTITAQVLANRGLLDKNSTLRFLNPSLSALSDIQIMKDVPKAFSIIDEAIRLGEKIVVYGDYDVDGVMSTTILYKSLLHCGAKVDFYIPGRSEGYGLNEKAIRKLHQEGAQLIITCDNGVAAVSEIDLAIGLGLKVVVIDHHEAPDPLPNATALVDPKQKNCPYPFKLYCAAGLSYRFVQSFFSFKGIFFVYNEEFLALATIATFCDVVELLDENRILAKNGLAVLNKNKKLNLGLYTLMEKRNLLHKSISPFDIGFVIGPCINATGRLSNASLAVRLLTEKDPEQAGLLAEQLITLNEERKLLTTEAIDEAIRLIESTDIKSHLVYVLFSESIHESIAGIVAGRIRDRFFHPTIVLTQCEGFAKGSARSIDGYNIYTALAEHQSLYLHFGGHSMAAGLSLVSENVEVLQQKLNEACPLTESDFCPVLRIDKELPLSYITYELATELNSLAPFGKANHEPLFGTKNQKVISLRVIEEKNTLIFEFEDKRVFKAICFGKVDYFAELLEENFDGYTCEKIFNGFLGNVELFLDILYSIEINEYNNDVSVQLRLKDFRISK